MSKLDRWLPFKSRRKSTEEKQAQAESPSASSQGGAGLGGLGGPRVSELMRLFDEPLFRDPFTHINSLDRWFGDFSPSRFSPTVDVVDEENAVRVSAELPGLDKDSIQLNVDNHVLTIRGEKRNEDESKENGVYRTERYYGYFQRAIPLPQDVDVDSAEASFDKGVLSIRLPKQAQAQESGRQIPVKG